MDFSTIPLHTVIWSDIAALVGRTESVNLEFKRDLHVPKGGQHPWHHGHDLDKPARNALAAEVVALANAWGGTVVLGADEDRSTPRICSGITPLPRVSELADKLEAALRSLIDPPLSNFDCRAVLSPDQDGSGVVLLRVARSILAPHGHGHPPASYIRRGAVTAPMTMQDLQNLFWDSRTRSERIAADRAAASQYLSDAAAFGELHNDLSLGFPGASIQGLFFRFGAYPHASLELQDLDSRAMWLRMLRPEARWLFEKSPSLPSGDGLIGWSPEPIAHGIQVLGSGPSRWVIRDTGSIEVFGYRNGVSQPSNPDAKLINPAWIVGVGAQILAMVEILRRRARKPGVPFEVDAEVLGKTVISHNRINDWEEESREISNRPSKVGPFIYGREETFSGVYGAIEREIWHALGLAHVKAFKPTPERAIAELTRLMIPHEQN